MIYSWFFIFNADEFDATGLVSRTYTVTFENIGPKDILVTKANLLGMTYEGIFLPLELNDKSPFEFEGFAAYKDENENVWLGINGRDE